MFLSLTLHISKRNAADGSISRLLRHSLVFHWINDVHQRPRGSSVIIPTASELLVENLTRRDTCAPPRPIILVNLNGNARRATSSSVAQTF